MVVPKIIIETVRQKVPLEYSLRKIETKMISNLVNAACLTLLQIYQLTTKADQKLAHN